MSRAATALIVDSQPLFAAPRTSHSANPLPPVCSDSNTHVFLLLPNPNPNSSTLTFTMMKPVFFRNACGGHIGCDRLALMHLIYA